MLEVAIEANYGLALPAFVEYLISERALEALLREYRDEFAAKLRGRSSSQQSRYIENFAMVFAAGRLAVRYGVAPFTLDQLSAAVTALFDQSALVQMTHKQHMTAAVSAIVALGEDRDRCAILGPRKKLENTQGKTVAARINRKGEMLFIPTANLPALLPKDCTEKAFLAFVNHAGILRVRDNARTKQCAIAGLVAGSPRPSGYMLDWSKLQKLAATQLD